MATAGLLAAGLSIDEAVGVLRRFHAKVRVKNEAIVRKTLGARTPKADLAQAMADEAHLAQVFERRSHERFKAQLGRAAGEADHGKRVRMVQTAIAAERRYAVQRQQMVAQRSVAAVDRAALRRESPTGAAWRLDKSVKNHTPECVAMAGKFWPWAALDYHAFWPPVHGGCVCSLEGYGPAVSSGLIKAGQVPDVLDAIRAIQVIRDLHTREGDELELMRSREALVASGVLTRDQFDQSIVKLVEEALCQR